MRVRYRVVVTLISGVNGSCGDSLHRGVHQESTGDHNRNGGLPSHICALHRGVADARDEPVGVMVRPIHSK